MAARRFFVLGALAFLGLALGGCVRPSLSPAGGVTAVLRAEPREGPAPLTVRFDASRSLDPAGALTDYLWDFGDGAEVASGAVVEHTYRRAGEYVVTLVVVGPSGTGRATALIRVLNNPPKAAFSVWPSDPWAEEPVAFDASPSSDPDGDPLRYLWDFGDGRTGEGKLVQHAYTKAGEYVVVLTVVDPSGAEGRAT
ncbi:MAG: PKD domain-containing protein, partial [Candidatus Bipolaricaulaceae bacterium]